MLEGASFSHFPAKSETFKSGKKLLSELPYCQSSKLEGPWAMLYPTIFS